MRIAIASDDGKTIASHFGRTRGFVVVDVEDAVPTRREYRPNTFTGHAMGMEGDSHAVDRHAPILSALSDCHVVIARGMGRRIYDDLAEAGLEVFIADETDAERAVELYVKQELVDHPDRGCEHGRDDS